MTRQRGFWFCAAFLFLAVWPSAQNKSANSSLAGQKTVSDLPKVVRASAPFYPELARQTRIQGTVTLRVSTDGKMVSAVGAGNGHPILVKAAAENVKTWEFKPHSPTTFEVTFRYRLFTPECNSECNCDRGDWATVSATRIPPRMRSTRCRDRSPVPRLMTAHWRVVSAMH